MPSTSPTHVHMPHARTHAHTQMCGNRKLEKLDLSSNAITDAGMHALSPALAQLALLADLNLASNHITLSGMVHFFSAFLPIEESGAERADTGWAKEGYGKMGLERLDVSGNCFGDLGALCTAFALSGQSSLQSLALSHCQVFSVSPPCFTPVLAASFAPGSLLARSLCGAVLFICLPPPHPPSPNYLLCTLPYLLSAFAREERVGGEFP